MMSLVQHEERIGALCIVPTAPRPHNFFSRITLSRLFAERERKRDRERERVRERESERVRERERERAPPPLPVLFISHLVKGSRPVGFLLGHIMSIR